MEMTTYQAVFAVLLIFFLGDLVGALTKAKISSMFVIMMGFLVLFMTGIYPDNVMEISGFAGVASLGQYFLLFNMGTSVDIPTLKREWRTVLCATVGMAAAILGCVVVIPLIGKEYSMAAAPVVNGGIVATTTMVQACENLGLDTAAALATFVYAVQKFVGTLPASNCGLSVAKDLVADLRAKHAADPDYSWYKEMAGDSAGNKKALFWEKYKKYYTTFICLAIAAAHDAAGQHSGRPVPGLGEHVHLVHGAGHHLPQHRPGSLQSAAGLCQGQRLLLLPVPVHHHSLPGQGGLGPAARHRLQGRGDLCSRGHLHVHRVLSDPRLEDRGQQEPVHRHCHVPADRLSGTELIATEITNAVAQTPEERDAISSKIQTAYVISGFASVTILSVFIASFLAKLMGA